MKRNKTKATRKAPIARANKKKATATKRAPVAKKAQAKKSQVRQGASANRTDKHMATFKDIAKRHSLANYKQARDLVIEKGIEALR